MGLEKFIENVDKASYLADTTGVAIEKLPDHIQGTNRELYSVTIDLFSKKAEREQALRECDETKALLYELKRKKVQTSKELTNLQEIKALGEDTLIRSLSYYIGQWLWEKTAREILANELGEAHKSLYFISGLYLNSPIQIKRTPSCSYVLLKKLRRKNLLFVKGN